MDGTRIRARKITRVRRKSALFPIRVSSVFHPWLDFGTTDMMIFSGLYAQSLLHLGHLAEDRQPRTSVPAAPVQSQAARRAFRASPQKVRCPRSSAGL